MTMKRILSIIAAGALALLAFSCAKEEDKAVYDTTQTTPPVLLSATVGDNVTVQFTPAVFQMGFNEKMATFHTLGLVSVNGTATNVTLSTKVDGNTITLTGKNLTSILKARGCKALDQVAVEIVVRASIQDPSRGITNGYVDSNEKHSFTWTMPEESEQAGCPYEGFDDDSDWTLIGAMEAYGINWDGDLKMWTNGVQHVAAHVTLKAGDEVKFRKDQAWTVNMGGDFDGLDSEFAVSQDGPNIKVGADGVYDLFLDPDAGAAWVAAAFDPYPDYTEESNWSVIGALSLAGINWDGDIAMVSDGANHAAFGVALDAADEFKFRQDKAWTVNLGGDFEALGSEFAVSQDGPNIKVGAAGVFDLFVNPDAATATVMAASGVKVSSKLGGDEPGPEPVQVTGWNIIGLNGDWENDIIATQDGNTWTAYITAEAETTFKWRKDGGWDENYGGTFVALGEPFAAEAGGSDIAIPAGFYKVVLDTEALTITIFNGEVWSLIGDFNEWAGDVDMVLTDGKWVSPATKLEGGFKIRHNHGWDENFGGTMVALGEPFAAVAGGDNISVEAGTYVVTYDPTAATITVDELGWGLVGTINGWGGTPDIMLKEDGLFLVAKNVALTADDEIKIRYNQSWDENRGGATVVGVPVKAEAGGANIKPGVAGNYDVYYRPDCEVIIVNNAGAELSYWGVVGTINSWGAPDKILYQNADGLLESAEIEISETDEIKIRKNEDWAENRGGNFAELGEAIAVEANGPNIKVGRAAKIQVIYDAAAETVTLKGEYTGDAPSAPTTMYMIGSQWGGWNWEDAGIVEMVPVWGAPGYFWCTRWFDASMGFKFCAQKAWSGDFTGAGTVGYTVNDGNCWVAESGLYTVLVNGNDNSVEITPAEIYGLGDAVFTGGWDYDTAQKFTVEGDKVVITTTGAGELRIASKVMPSAAIDGVTTGNGWIDWWKTEFIFFGDGKLVYRGAGADQERYNIEAGKTITIDFNAGTATVSGGAAAQGITIDGDMSDWANIQGTTGEGGTNAAFKVYADATNVYFYVKRTTNRMADLWGGNGYHYYTFDLDNDATTGEELWGNGPYDMILVLYPYAGSADAPAFGIAKAGATAPSTCNVDNAVIKGVVTDSGVETEISIPRADLLEIPTTPVKVYYWSNKDGSEKLEVSVTL